ncbi:hypothetical protein MMC30_008036 [Trapelia coarctata]|nr:hypothetical protein [Trapelia coarctata]
MTSLLFLLSLLSLLPALAAAATPISYCKCTCFDNSTTIALDPAATAAAAGGILARAPSPLPASLDLNLQPLPPSLDLNLQPLPASLDRSPLPPTLDPRTDESDTRATAAEDDRKQYRASNCKDCNRQFCLGYNLPICKGAAEKDVSATCFREFYASLPV